MNPPLYLSGFRIVRPRFEKSQQEAIRWLAQAHMHAERAAGFPSGREDLSAELFEKLIAKFGCSPDKIANRGHELEDFTHLDWNKMSIFNIDAQPTGMDMEARQRIYDTLVRKKCDEIFPDHFAFGRDLIHVTCTGYLSPSPLQRLAVERGFASETRVLHAYHMGCYAALPATRIAAALNLQQLSQGNTNASAAVDIVHTELCTLHFNPLLHSPEQLVVQSLFADGFVAYRATPEPAKSKRSLRILALNEEQVPNSGNAMTWLPLPWGMAMSLSRDVPALISSSVRSFVDRLVRMSGHSVQDVLPGLVYAVHPGGPKIIDHLQELMEVSDQQLEASRSVLRRFGNMSSATLPHIWNDVLTDTQRYTSGTRVLSLAFGPGLTIAGGLFEIVDAS